jgi:protein gp37
MKASQKRIDQGMYWDRAWSLVEGCTKASEGCTHCWSESQAAPRCNNQAVAYRYQDVVDSGRWTGKINLMWQDLEKPLKVKKPQVWCIWNDLFHEDVPFDFIDKAFAIMAECPQHTFLLLSKRPNKMRKAINAIEDWDPADNAQNIWLGVTCENQARAEERIPILLQIPAAVRFVSVEPCLGPVDLRPYLPAEYWCFCGYVGDETGTDYCTSCEKEFGYDDDGGNTCVHCGHGEYDSACPECGDIESFGLWDTGPLDLRPPRLDWVLCGGETGPGARPIHPDWARSLRDQCQATGTKFLFKSWGEWIGGRFDRQKSKMVCDSADPNDKIGRIFWANPGAPKVHIWDEADHYWMHASARVGKNAAGRLLDGRTWDEFPEVKP